MGRSVKLKYGHCFLRNVLEVYTLIPANKNRRRSVRHIPTLHPHFLSPPWLGKLIRLANYLDTRWTHGGVAKSQSGLFTGDADSAL